MGGQDNLKQPLVKQLDGLGSRISDCWAELSPTKADNVPLMMSLQLLCQNLLPSTSAVLLTFINAGLRHNGIELDVPRLRLDRIELLKFERKPDQHD